MALTRSQIEGEKEPIATEDGNSIEEPDGNVTEEGGSAEEKNTEYDDNEEDSENDSVNQPDSDSDNDESGSDSDDNDAKHDASHPAMHSTRNSLLRKPKPAKGKNALTSLIPGYTAPMRLDSSSLDKYKCDISELGKRAERKDASTKDFCLEATHSKVQSSMKSSKGFLPKSYTAAYSHFKKGVKRAPDESAGKGWFGMKPAQMTEDLKKDLAMIRNRTYLDPKRFYKSTDKHHAVVQVGTVIEGAAEFYSSRLTKKDRRSNLTEELMADQATLDYAKNKFQKMAREKAYQAELRKNRPKKRKKFY